MSKINLTTQERKDMIEKGTAKKIAANCNSNHEIWDVEADMYHLIADPSRFNPKTGERAGGGAKVMKLFSKKQVDGLMRIKTYRFELIHDPSIVKKKTTTKSE